MKIPVFALAYLVSGSALLHEPLVAQTANDSAQLRQMTAAWNEAHIRGDAAVLADIWHPDLTVLVPGMASIDREAALAIVRSGRVTFTRYETANVTYRIYEGTAIEQGELTRHRLRGGETTIDRWRYSKVYLRTPTGWKVTAFHASEAVFGSYQALPRTRLCSDW